MVKKKKIKSIVKKCTNKNLCLLILRLYSEDPVSLTKPPLFQKWEIPFFLRNRYRCKDSSEEIENILNHLQKEGVIVLKKMKSFSDGFLTDFYAIDEEKFPWKDFKLEVEEMVYPRRGARKNKDELP